MKTKLRNQLLGLLAQDGNSAKLETSKNWRQLAMELYAALETNVVFAEGYVFCLRKMEKQQCLRESPATKEVRQIVTRDRKTFVTPFLRAEHRKNNPKIIKF